LIGEEVAANTITTGGGSSATNAFGDGRPGKALIDTDRHLQVDVLAMPNYELAIDSVKIEEVVPIDDTQNNPNIILSYDGAGNLSRITQTINSENYKKELTYDGAGNLSNVSAWVKL
ncbi:MAG TPA: hypothetical protein VIJ25_07830, partial [Methylococcales bacterium]